MPAAKPTPPASPLEVTADFERKILRTYFRGNVRGADLEPRLVTLPTLLKQLGPGFVLVTDLFELTAMDLDCVPHLTRIMDECLSAGVSKVVRVIPSPEKDIGFTLLSLTHYRGKVRIRIVKTRAEAEKELPRRA